jgi:hypothetical protein
MTISQRLDEFLRLHPKLFLLGIGILFIAVSIVLLGGLEDVQVVYKAF